MSENKTVETDASVSDFLDSIEHDTRKADARVLVDLMRRATGTEPRMWGSSIIGFGRYHYRYESGREGDMLRIGFSPRKANLALYLIVKGAQWGDLLHRLGKHRTGKSCLYVNKLADVDLEVLETMVIRSWERAREEWGPE